MRGYDATSYGDAFADVYDSWYHDVSDVDATVDLIRSLAGSGGRVLELGVGTGRLAMPMAAAGLRVTGVDSSERMLDRLRAADPDGTVAKDGTVEFWSSGGLMQRVPADAPSDEYESVSNTPKHIEVITLVPGKAAVAHYYSEGSFHVKGQEPVSGYLTRATQVFVKEGGKWKIRAAHWSPVAGGKGTNQTALD